MIAVVVRTRDPDRAAEALRAAVGLTLRGESVTLVAPSLPMDERIGRALATLRALNQPLDAPLSEAERVEVWT